jgi:hypothetical protein
MGNYLHVNLMNTAMDLLTGPVIINGVYMEMAVTQDGHTCCYTCSGEPLAWRYDRMCRDAGRVLFGNILTED